MFGARMYTVFVHINPFTSYISIILFIFMEGGKYQMFEVKLLSYLEFYYCCLHVCVNTCELPLHFYKTGSYWLTDLCNKKVIAVSFALQISISWHLCFLIIMRNVNI